ncbi:MAG: helix-turn-helix domain-containing protein [Lachnospiraceae bacterium]|nr:helix-turn-helix domain-containing protein [Lachnospiraceae bacterium]
MISNQILQNTLTDVKDVSGNELCLYETDGHKVAGTFKPQGSDKSIKDEIEKFVDSDLVFKVVGSHMLSKIYEDHQIAYILSTYGPDKEKIGRLCTLQIESLMIAYREKYDKDNFIRSLLMDNMLLVDIYSKAKKLRVEKDRRRVAFVIETRVEKDAAALETVRSLYAATRGKDFITEVDEKNIILIREVRSYETYEDLEKAGKVILDMLNTEAMSTVHVAFGTIVDELKDISRSYKEAKMALDIGKIFYSERNIVAYNKLGLGRLIYQLPVQMCRMFIHEIFGGKSPDDFDEETLQTINKFFENNLNVSETSRQLFIHRNTLVYRLDKLQKLTNLDLRVFDDAITFKMALMVVKYMKYMESMDY